MKICWLSTVDCVKVFLFFELVGCPCSRVIIRTPGVFSRHHSRFLFVWFQDDSRNRQEG